MKKLDHIHNFYKNQCTLCGKHRFTDAYLHTKVVNKTKNLDRYVESMATHLEKSEEYVNKNKRYD